MLNSLIDKRTARRSDVTVAALPPVHLGVAIRSHWPLIGLMLLTVGLKTLIFAPISIWPVAFVCLVPWVIGVGTAAEARRVYVYSYLLGFVFFLINMRWMYVACGSWYIAMAAYLAVYFPLMACPLRHVVRRRRLPLGIVLPIIWVGCEMLRAVVISGFPWFYLSHSLYEVLTLIQPADLVGAYGTSFLIAAINGALADVILARVAVRSASKPGANKRQARISVAFASVLLLSTFVYGQYQLRRETSSPGPRIAVIQGDYLNSIAIGAARVKPSEKRNDYLALMAQASQHHPDLYLLPESAWLMYLNPEFRALEPSVMDRSRWFRDYFGRYKDPVRGFLALRQLSRTSFQKLESFARENNAYVVVGAGSIFPTPYDLLSDIRTHNSAFVFEPSGSEPQRYDKKHLVYFGEIVPFRFGRLRSLYFWLNAMIPFSGENNSEYSLFPGESFKTLSMQCASRGGQSYRFATPICYEDVMPYVSRVFATGVSRGDLHTPRPAEDKAYAGKQVDFLLNISNDGWFGRGVQQPQHLAICVMRAVENRVGIARSVNTGISGFVDPSGRLHDLVTSGSGYAVGNVWTDTRFSFYSRYGDWFAWTCAVLWLAFYVDYFVVRARARRAEERMAEAK